MKFIVVLACLVACCAGSDSGTAPWPQLGCDAAHSGHLSSAPTAVNGDVVWEMMPSSSPIRSSPCISADYTVFFGVGPNATALSPDGSTKWHREFPEGNSFDASPALSPPGDLVYFGSASGTLFALSTDTGETVWTWPSSGNVYGSPVVDKDGNVYFSTTNNHLNSVSSSGRLRWSSELQGGRATPAIFGDNVYAVSDTRKGVVGYSLAKGTLQVLQTFSNDGEVSDITVCPSGDRGMVLYGVDTVLEAVDTATGELMFNVSTGTATRHAAGNGPACGADMLFWGSPNGKLYAFDSAGVVQWTAAFSAPLASRPVVSGDSMVIGISSKGVARAFDIKTGVQMWELSLCPNGITASPALDGQGNMFVGAWNGHMYRVGKKATPGTNHNPPLSTGGIVAVVVVIVVVLLAGGIMGWRHWTRHGDRTSYSEI